MTYTITINGETREGCSKAEALDALPIYKRGQLLEWGAASDFYPGYRVTVVVEASEDV